MGINRNDRINRLDINKNDNKIDRWNNINRNDRINRIDRWNKGCKCCHGSGTQMGKDGINILCPCCHGTGQGKKTQPYRRFT